MIACSLFQRNKSKWKLVQSGYLQRLPRMGERVVVAKGHKNFSHTEVIVDVVDIVETDPNAIEIVFQDADTMWKLMVPAHSNDINLIKTTLKESENEQETRTIFNDTRRIQKQTTT